MEYHHAAPREGCVLRLRTSLPGLRPSEQKVAQYIIDHPEEVVNISVTELSRRSGVSDATVVKLSQRIGYVGYQDLKINLAKELPLHLPNIHGEMEPGDSLESIKMRIFSLNEKALNETSRILSSAELAQATKVLSAARRVILFGSGASSIVALDAEIKLLRIGIHCNAFADPHLACTTAALLSEDDVAIGISHSGATRDTTDTLQAAQEAGATTICITNYLSSPIAAIADVCLLTAVEENDFRSGAIASRVAQLTIVDVLFSAVALERYSHTISCLEKTRDAVVGKRY